MSWGRVLTAGPCSVAVCVMRSYGKGQMESWVRALFGEAMVRALACE